MDTLTANAPTREYADGKMLAAKEDGIGFITFNQPEKRNAMSVEMWQGLAEILDDYGADANVRVVIMTGAGNIVEIQATAEKDPFSEDQFLVLLALARKGIEKLVGLQKMAVM